jgi:hypothetical protein
MKITNPASRILFWWLVAVIVDMLFTLIGAIFYNHAWGILPSLILALIMVIITPLTSSCHKYPWFMKFVAFFNKDLIPVELIDFTCERTYSIATLHPDGKLHAPNYWMHSIGDSILLPNGFVDMNSAASYQYFWLPLRKNERVAFLLTNEIPDFTEIENLSRDERREMLYKIRINSR